MKRRSHGHAPAPQDASSQHAGSLAQQRQSILAASDPGHALVEALRDCLTEREGESDDEAKVRIHDGLCALLDEVGATAVVECLQRLRSIEPHLMFSVAREELRMACLRCEGEAFGKPYHAYLRLLPLVVWGKTPAHFPAALDALTCLRINDILGQLLAMHHPHGDEMFALPLSYAYTMAEFADLRVERVHETLRGVFGGLQGFSDPEAAPKFVTQKAEVAPGERCDDEMYNLQPSTIGVRGWKDRNVRRHAGRMAVGDLPPGQWVTMRLVPVVVLAPHGQTPPTIPDFGVDGPKCGQVMSFACADAARSSDKPGAKLGEFEEVSITPVGLFTVGEGPSFARMSIGQSRILLDVQECLAEDLQEPGAVMLRYQANTGLNVLISRGGQLVEDCSIHLQPGAHAHRFVEDMSAALHSLGIEAHVDLGDSMIRLGDMPTRALH